MKDVGTSKSARGLEGTTLGRVVLGVSLLLAAACSTNSNDGRMPQCSDICRVAEPNGACDISDSMPCANELCIKTCSDYAMFIAPDSVVCTCDQFAADQCFTPACIACEKSALPASVRDLPGITGVGLLCRPDGKTPCCQGELPDDGHGCRLACPCNDPSAVCPNP